MSCNQFVASFDADRLHIEMVENDDWTSEGDLEKRRPRTRKRKKAQAAQLKETGGRMMLDRWTQAILPPGSDDNPNVPGV